jgi:hypothetical protein
MGGADDTKMLHDTLPRLAVVQPGGQPVQMVSPEAFLYMPKEQMQSACDALPRLAVVVPGGQPVQMVSPEAFLYMPTGQGVQLKVPIANTCPALHEVFPTIQPSNEMTSASVSVRLYTSTV